MIARKEIIVLNGGGHKGIVKISAVAGKSGYAKIGCSLDFRPNGAKLYLIGDNIAQMAVNDTNCEDEVPFSAGSEIGCVLRSSAITMFGGAGSKSEMLKKIEEFSSRSEGKSKRENRTDEISVAKIAESKSDKDSDEVTINKSFEEGEKKPYVGVSARDALGEWTKYDGNNFYYAIKPQIDEMFVCYPSEETLGATVPNSKWVKIDAEDGYYVVGLLYDEDEISFICYGVPQARTEGQPVAPEELAGMCVWLPLGGDGELSGYWIIYQSARTGEIIK